MEKVRLGKTDLMVTKTAFGCLPIQRCSNEDAVAILRRAFDAGINYYDTANAYTDSEYKLGLALGDVRKDIIISTKSTAKDGKTLTAHLENSLRMLKTDYIDLYQLHLPPELPDVDDPNGAYAAAVEAQKKGYIRHIGITAHNLDLAFDEVACGKYETIMFPFSYLYTEREAELVDKCIQADMGFIAMKGLAGGMLDNARACYCFMKQYPSVVPVWGIQRMSELEEWISLTEEDPDMDDASRALIAKDRVELAESFCRGCGYCMPCPAGIEINNCMRMSLMLRRSVWQMYCDDTWRAKMEQTKDCIHCGACLQRCPYGLDAQKMLPVIYDDYTKFYAEHKHLM